MTNQKFNSKFDQKTDDQASNYFQNSSNKNLNSSSSILGNNISENISDSDISSGSTKNKGLGGYNSKGGLGSIKLFLTKHVILSTAIALLFVGTTTVSAMELFGSSESKPSRILGMSKTQSSSTSSSALNSSNSSSGSSELSNPAITFEGSSLSTQSQSSSSIQSLVSQQPSQSSVVSSSSQTQADFPKPVLIGDLGIFKDTYNQNRQAKYYSLGKTSAMYPEHEKILVSIYYPNIKVDSKSYLLITKDRQNFIMADSVVPGFNSGAIGGGFDEKRVKLEKLNTDFTPVIDLFGDMTLGISGYEGLKPEDPELNLDSLQKLDSKDGRYRFFWDNRCQSEKTYQGVAGSGFCGGSSDVLVQDRNGVVVKYELNFDNLTRYNYNPNPNDFGTIARNPFLKKENINTSLDLYTEYDPLFPEMFGRFGLDILKNIGDEELESIGSVYNTTIYGLKNKNHELYKNGYEMKKNNRAFRGANIPTFEEYVAKNPILIFKDRWNRTISLMEAENLNQMGGAKPVLYFYPKTESEINVKFDTEMQLDVEIPRYNTQKGWNIKATPSGQLTDLQAQLTNCKDFENPVFGQEYALQSCLQNKYPYIYWAGGSTTKRYPKGVENTGFVVSNQDLENTLKQKLSYIGLNDQEIKDFLEYWLPKLKSKNKPFYRLTFLQNQELSELFPTSISPKPDSFIRVFLDWQELDSEIQIPEQKLISYTRDGFVVVEWGGLKK